MSGTPYDLEQQEQESTSRPQWNPWNGPSSPSWSAGLGFNEESHYLGPFGRALDAAGSGAAKGEAVLGGLIHGLADTNFANLAAGDAGAVPDMATSAPPAGQKAALDAVADAVSADAKMRVQALTPNAATTGAAVQLLHGIVSGGTEMAIGGLAGGLPGAAALVGSAEGTERYNQLIDAGVDPDTARKSGLLAGATSAVGAVVPGGIGSTLFTRVTSGAVGNTLFGIANRYADHKILESAGYPEMAAQQKIIDSTQVITDLILGAAFGGLAHLHAPEVEALRDAPGAREAALTTNLAIKDRESAPGVAADPQAANAHQDALESSIADLMQGRAVDVSDSGVTEAKFVKRPADDSAAYTVQMVRQDLERTESDLRETVEGPEGQAVNLRRDDAATTNRLAKASDAMESASAILSEDREAQVKREAERLSRTDEGNEYAVQRARESGLADVVHPDVQARAEQSVDATRENAQRQLDVARRLKQATQEDASRTTRVRSAESDLQIHQNTVKNAKTLDDLLEALPPEKRDFYRRQMEQNGTPAHTLDPEGGRLEADRVEEPRPEPEPKLTTRTPPKAIEDFNSDEALRELDAVISKSSKAGAAGDASIASGATAQAVAERPDLTIPDENGNPVSAHEALAQVRDEVATKRRESKLAVESAVTCYMRRGN